ncbi:uncharacterized mitochondrial protein AtMg00310-like [Beta vulgaris subsp. vulgaris]|uniref:uncharacterized mitochondrial protein AtMg00310-like n=1 Tax=Beta vulgaris subsp. vulgaris TaxID=3555 RepID=UPI0025465F58|nr:uncharacterized mitochondrial protein AtMg00310-like [Beta vulgaris subsp. vulgaris]
MVFRELLDRMWKKLRGWKEKLLSRAGKEVLIKAVIQALPTYLMGVYEIPTAIIKEIHSVMARFWWGGKGVEKKMHWQVWRLLHYKNSLLSRVMNAKYYPHGDIFQARLGYSNSYSWSSIWSAKSLVKEGLIWKVGDGKSINLWHDPWLSDEDGRFVLSNRVAGLKLVGDLIDNDRKEWKTDVIENLFEERDQKCILAIPLSSRCLQDELTWATLKMGPIR